MPRSTTLPRRRFLKLGLATASVATASFALPFLHGCSQKSQPHIVIVGGGFGGATCARYLKILAPASTGHPCRKATYYYHLPF